MKGVKVVPLEENVILEQTERIVTESLSAQEEEDNEKYLSYEKVLTKGNNWKRKSKIVERLRLLLRDDEEAMIFMGANGFVEALFSFCNQLCVKGMRWLRKMELWLCSTWL